MAAARTSGRDPRQGDALALPFADDAFDSVVSCIFTATWTRRSAPPSCARPAVSRRSSPSSSLARRLVLEGGLRLMGGSSWQVFKRWFTPNGLLDELGGGEVLHAGPWFVVVRSPR